MKTIKQGPQPLYLDEIYDESELSDDLDLYFLLEELEWELLDDFDFELDLPRLLALLFPASIKSVLRYYITNLKISHIYLYNPNISCMDYMWFTKRKRVIT